MRTISIQEAKVEISVYHSYGHKINTSSPGWQEIRVKGRRNRKKEIVVKIKPVLPKARLVLMTESNTCRSTSVFVVLVFLTKSC